MEVPINDFDDIRPLNNDEVKDAIESLVANEDFERAFRYIKPDVDWKEFSETMRSFKTKEDFKTKLAYEAVMMVAKSKCLTSPFSRKLKSFLSIGVCSPPGSITAHSSLFTMAIYTLYLSLSRKEKIPSALFNEITISEESPPATIAMFLFIIYSSLVFAYTRHLSINAVMSAGISESKNISSPVVG